MRPRVWHWFGGLLAMLCGACGSGDGDGDADGSGVPVTFTLQIEVRTPSQINLTWTAHPGAVSGYSVLRDGAPAFPTQIRGTQVPDNDLDPDTQYC